jgi:ketosteroid isomerase-like protein
MSEENFALVRTVLEAFMRQDAEVMNALVSPDVEWDARDGGDLIPAELAGIHRGEEEGQAFWGAWISTWKDIKFDYELRDAGDQVAALISNQRQWGRRSGVETEIPPYAWTYTVREGRLVGGRFFPDHESALEALGKAE